MGKAASSVDKAFPPNGVLWRGGGFRNTFKTFFTVGLRFRIPAFYATSFSKKIASQFAFRQSGKHFRAICRVQVDPRGAQDPLYRVKHAAYVRNTLVKGEGEYLFSPYSVFEIEHVAWSDKLEDPHVLHLKAALDNVRESEKLPLAPWY